jgi:hypothetical protein
MRDRLAGSELGLDAVDHILSGQRGQQHAQQA